MNTYKSISSLILGGGGIKCLSFLGALEILTTQGLNLNKLLSVGGSSIGAIISVLLALNYELSEIETILQPVHMIPLQHNHPNDLYRVLGEFGAHQRTSFKEWIGHYIEQKTGCRNINFSDLHQFRKFKAIYISVINHTKQCSEIFSYQHTPTLDIADALICSLATEISFPPIKLNHELSGEYRIDIHGDIYISGELLTELPPDLSIENGLINNTTLVQSNDLNKQNTLVLYTDYQPRRLNSQPLPNYHNDKSELLNFVNNMTQLHTKLKNIICINSHKVNYYDFELNSIKINYLINAGRSQAMRHVQNNSNSLLTKICLSLALLHRKCAKNKLLCIVIIYLLLIPICFLDNKEISSIFKHVLYYFL